MSRSAEEQLLLEQRIEAMKRKNEELRRRHLEVEADALSAAKQNAMVQIKSPYDDEWVPGGRPERLDVSVTKQSPSGQDHSKSDFMQHQRGSQNEGQREGREQGQSSDETERHFNSAPSMYQNQNQQAKGRCRLNPNSRFIRGRRSDFQDRRPNSEEWSEEYKHSGERERSGQTNIDNTRNQYKDWSGERPSHSTNDGSRNHQYWQHQSRRDEGHLSSGEPSQNRTSSGAVPSKVFKNSSMDGDNARKPNYRLSAGDGPPRSSPYSSILDDDDRDPPEVVERRQELANRRNFSRGHNFSRAGRSWNNRRFEDSREPTEGDYRDKQSARSGDNYDAWRRERNQIDQDRINRQKKSDGNWSREWDNNKVPQEDHSRPQGRGNRGYRQHHRGGRGTTEHAGGFAQMRMKQMRAGNFPAFMNNIPTQISSHEHHTQKARYEPKEEKGSMSEPTSSQDAQISSEEQVEDVPNKPELKTVEDQKQEVSSCSDESGVTANRSVSEINGSIQISVVGAMDCTSETLAVTKRHRMKSKRERSSRVSNKTPEPKDDDGSWEDVSSEEEVISEISEIARVKKGESTSSKPVDVSSGPESLDPIPTTGKEDGFLWDEYHTSGFHGNLAIDMNAEEVYKTLLDKRSKEGGDDSGDLSIPCPAFKLDTHCLEESDGEEVDSKLDPLLVTTQIVQAEVDKMSLPLCINDTSLPDEILSSLKNETLVESELESPSDASPSHEVCAEELSGPVSILQVHSPQPVSSDSEVSFQSVDSPDTPKKELVGTSQEVATAATICSEAVTSHENSSEHISNETGEVAINNEQKVVQLSLTDLTVNVVLEETKEPPAIVAEVDVEAVAVKVEDQTESSSNKQEAVAERLEGGEKSDLKALIKEKDISTHDPPEVLLAETQSDNL